MAFTLNQGQGGAAPQAGGVSAAPQPGMAVASQQTSQGLPSVPDSPFLFMRQRGGEVSVNAYLQILLAVVALVSVIVATVLFTYRLYLTSSIESKKSEITLRDASFKDYPYDDMRRLSKRMENLSLLMQKYVSARSPLKILEDVVEKQVVFDNYVLSRKGDAYTVVFAVLTTNYRALIQQLEALSLAQYAKIAPQPKTTAFSDGVNALKIVVTAPVLVQGLLPEQVNFLPQSGSQGGSTGGVIPTASTTSNQ